MRRLVPGLLILLLLLPAAQATPGHDGLEPAAVTMHIHFAGQDVLPMQPMAPAGYALPASPELAPACGSDLRWSAVFTQVPVAGDVVWTDGLARDAELGPARPQLTWYVETVQPGSDEPLPVDAPEMRLQAELRSGQDVGQGRLLGHTAAATTPTPVDVEGRSVHRIEARLDWDNQTILQAEGFHLTLRLDMGTDACRTAPPAMRAYADTEHRPRLEFEVFEPVRIDVLEPRLAGEDWQIVWHASSPWGRFDLQEPDAPAVRGPGGDAPAPRLVHLQDASALEMTWTWDPGAAPNGTYRIDAAIRNAAGDEATATALFRLGADAPPKPQEEPVKESPAPLLLPLLAILVLRRISR